MFTTPKIEHKQENKTWYSITTSTASTAYIREHVIDQAEPISFQTEATHAEFVFMHRVREIFFKKF